ncbi:MAG: T9SS type A sorting domain-containing protein, partial [Flavisolibacter sp.]
VATYNNLTNKAAFTSVAPNAQGQIIVKITGSSSYNYLNGFKISEVSGTLTTSTLKVATTETTTTTPALDVFPNPVTDKFALQVNNDYTGAMDVQIFDMTGALRKEFQLTKSQTGVSQTYLSIGDLTAGNYVIKVQMANWSESKQIVKL